MNLEIKAYIRPEHKHLDWKITSREGYRQYFCDSQTCKACPCREACFGASVTRRMVERHAWQDALDKGIAFAKSMNGRRIYSWGKEAIERSFAEAKVNHGLRYVRMLGIRNMRKQFILLFSPAHVYSPLHQRFDRRRERLQDKETRLQIRELTRT